MLKTRITLTTIFVLFITYIAIVWLPIMEYFYVPATGKIQLSQIATFKSSPNKNTFSTYQPLFDTYMMVTPYEDFYDEVIAPPEKLHPITSKYKHFWKVGYFSESQMKSGNSAAQLSLNSLSVPFGFLKLYEKNGDVTLLEAALNYALEYADYEYHNWFDESFLYNDHAVASRAITISRLWYHYKDYEGFNPKIAIKIIEYAAHLGSRLLKESFYTYKSNHGTMQNIGLLVLSSAFPSHSKANVWSEVGTNRLIEQIGFLQSSEGLFLEHSYEYHELFHDLISAVAGITKATGNSRALFFSESYDNALSVMNMLVRPNNSLPFWGDTSNSIHELFNPTFEDFKVFPVSGISIDSTPSAFCEDGSFVSSFWSHFDNHAHKRMDDMGVDIWSCGVSWYRGAGYVQYWHPLRSSSEGWRGSNAPHLENEMANSGGQVSIINQAKIDQATFLRLRRKVNNGYIERWLINDIDFTAVVDVYDGLKGQFETIWTLDNNVRLQSLRLKRLRASDNINKYKVESQFISDADFTIEHIRGHQKSIIGWVANNGRHYKTSSVKVSGKLSDHQYLGKLSVLTGANLGSKSCSPKMSMTHEKHDQMTVSVLGCGVNNNYQIDDNQFIVVQGVKETAVKLQVFDNHHLEEIRQIDNATNAIFSKYGPKFKVLFKYRYKVSKVALLLLLASCIVLLLVRWLLSQKFYSVINISAIACWVVLNIWIGFFYFN